MRFREEPRSGAKNIAQGVSPGCKAEMKPSPNGAKARLTCNPRSNQTSTSTSNSFAVELAHENACVPDDAFAVAGDISRGGVSDQFRAGGAQAPGGG
jgi:hypothetical protein